MFRRRAGGIEVFLAHPGGPFFQNRDEGYWTIPKGEVQTGEDLLETAKREFAEEVGEAPHGDSFHPIGWIRQKGGKIVHAWAFEGDWPEGKAVESNRFKVEWPPGSGRKRSFPEVDRAVFFSIREARERIKSTQEPFLDRLEEWLSSTLR